MVLLKLLFILTLFTVTLGQLARIDFHNGIAFTATDIGTGILFLSWLLYILFTKKVKMIFKDSVTQSIFLFIVVCAVSLLVNLQKFSLFQLSISSLYLFRWAAYASIYGIVQVFDEKFKSRISLLLVLVGFVTVVFGYIQYIYYNSLKNLFYLGWDDHMYRIFSVFLDPNFVGAFFILLLIILFPFFVERKKLFTPQKFLLVLLLAFIVAAIFLTHSRSTIIMFIVSVSTFLWMLQKKGFIIGVFLFVFLAMTFFAPQFYIENINLFRTVSTKARIETTSTAINIFKDNPVFGIGFNTYRYYQIQHGFRVGPGAIYSHSDAGTDNSILFVLATTGIVGIVAYIHIWKKILERALRLFRTGNKKERIQTIVIISSIFGIFAHSLFVNSLFYPFLMLWIWILSGLLPQTATKENR